jgi:hypothetical protein
MRSSTLPKRSPLTEGDTIPAPRSFDELKHDREFRADAAEAIVTMVQPRRLPADA